jgi:hypothetical protein
MGTNRSDFNNTWLLEMPVGLGGFETFDMLEYNIKDRIKYGSTIHKLQNNLNKIQNNKTVFYWFGDNNNIILGSELYIQPQGLVVSITGKNPRYKGKPPFASQLYDEILNDTDRSIKLLSDTQLSDEGYNIWKRLYSMGHKISVYNRQQPGKTFTTLDSISDFDKYFAKDDNEYEKYQFVLSESTQMLAETRSYFNTRRYRELAGISLID